jgi:hypothetical protein
VDETPTAEEAAAMAASMVFEPDAPASEVPGATEQDGAAAAEREGA